MSLPQRFPLTKQNSQESPFQMHPGQNYDRLATIGSVGSTLLYQIDFQTEMADLHLLNLK